MRRCFDGYTSAGKYLGPRTFGHTGFTGMSTLFETIICHSHSLFVEACLLLKNCFSNHVQNISEGGT